MEFPKELLNVLVILQTLMYILIFINRKSLSIDSAKTEHHARYMAIALGVMTLGIPAWIVLAKYVWYNEALISVPMNLLKWLMLLATPPILVYLTLLTIRRYRRNSRLS